MYSSEVFPQVYREVGMSLACAVNFSFAGTLAMAVPQYANQITSKHLKLLGVFAVLDGIAAVFVWLYMRSPEGAKSLEDMNVWQTSLPSLVRSNSGCRFTNAFATLLQFLFGAPSMDYICYQVRVASPWTIRQIFWLFGEDKTKVTFDEWQRKRRRAQASGDETGVMLGNLRNSTGG